MMIVDDKFLVTGEYSGELHQKQYGAQSFFFELLSAEFRTNINFQFTELCTY